MPGTPVIYYGDEIGMGDNIHLGDRDGVRTPMQWSPDRNGGFSRADPAALVLPPIMDPLYGYEAVNVEAQSRDPHSLLNWMRRMLAVRRRHHGVRPRHADASSIRRTARSSPICASTRTRRSCASPTSPHSPQAVELDLSDFAGRVPVELDGGSLFPPIGQLTYLLTLPPYGFYWFVLWRGERLAGVAHAGTGADAGIRDARHSRQPRRRRWLDQRGIGHRSARCCRLHRQAPLVRRRRTRRSRRRAVARLTNIGDANREILLSEIEVKQRRRHEHLAAAAGDRSGRTNRRRPCPISLRWRGCGAGGGSGLLTDAFALPRFARASLRCLAAGKQFAACRTV